MTSAGAAPFERLARMIERELELVAHGRLDEFQKAVDDRAELLRSLPSPAPEAAWPAVERARALHVRVLIEAERLRQELARSQAALQTSQRVARGYGGPAARRYSTSA